MESSFGAIINQNKSFALKIQEIGAFTEQRLGLTKNAEIMKKPVEAAKSHAKVFNRGL